MPLNLRPNHRLPRCQRGEKQSDVVKIRVREAERSVVRGSPVDVATLMVWKDGRKERFEAFLFFFFDHESLGGSGPSRTSRGDHAIRT